MLILSFLIQLLSILRISNRKTTQPILPMTTKKLLVLHPPFYETNYAFYDEIGQYTDLSIFMFGDQPKEQPDWHVKDLYKPEQHHFRLRCLGKGSYPFFCYLFC